MMFDIYDYFEKLAAKNKLAKQEKFKFCLVSGLQNLEEAVKNMQREKAFFCVDDISDGGIMCQNGVFFTRYCYTLFLLKRFDRISSKSRIEALNVCRDLRKQFYARMLQDSSEIEAMIYLNKSNVLFREFEKSVLAGCTGTYFMIYVDVPTDMSYNGAEWDD